MPYTVKNVCMRLLQAYDENTPAAVLVWTKEDVMDCAENMDITDEEARRVLEDIACGENHWLYGVGRDTVRDMLSILREQDAQMRAVSVPAAALGRVLRVANDYMRLEDAQSGEGSAMRLWPSECEAIRDITNVLKP